MSISLVKGQKISLDKESDDQLSRIVVACGWDEAKSVGSRLGSMFGVSSGESIDLDLSALVFDENKQLLETVYFGKLSGTGIKHSGDNLTGAGSGDDETITISLNDVSTKTKSIVFTINSFRGQSFNSIDKAFCRVYNPLARNKEYARYDLSAKGEHTAMIMSRLYKHGSEWKFEAIGEMGMGRVAADLVSLAKTTF